MKQAIAIIALFCAAAALYGCGAIEGTLPPGPGVLTSITVSPAPVRFAKASGTYKFTATGYTQYGGHIFIFPTWSASKEAGTVNPSGLLTISSEAGTGEVTASFNGISGSSIVTVTNGTLANITITSPTNGSVAFIGSRYQYTALGVDSLGNSVTINPNWSISPAVGLFDITNNGVFTPTVVSPFATVTAAQVSATPGSVGIQVMDDPTRIVPPEI